MKRVLAVLTVVVLLFVVGCSGAKKESGGATPAPAATRDPIKLGAIFDLSGGTADVGKPHGEGARAYIEYINGKGGVNGAKIDLHWVDYAYQTPKAVEAYNKLTKQDNVVAVMGWGTGDTEAMKELIAKDKIPYISGSYSEQLIDPAKTPYNFIVAPTYSQASRVLLDWAKAKKADAKVALVYNDSGFGKSPLEDAKAYAGKIGLKWVGEVVVALNASDATTQVLELKKQGADFVLIQETTNATAVTLKSAKQQGLTEMQFMGLAYSVDENLIKAAGDAAEGFVGVPAFAFPYEDGAGIKEAVEYAKSKGIKVEDLNQKWLQGWAFGRIMAEALRRAGDKPTGESIRKAFEEMKDYDLGGLGSPLTFSPTDHGGAKKGRIYQVKSGKWQPITEFVAPKQ
ncbi:MAG TPA: ABC transporter substrate-binding protein [Symbiobacteriaceae bacterium]|nr:ABC transporter substrate-binding protein [Symbiobacteriaceae bacterium]